jgi:peptidoglycan/LPS O-acetylase OafA/YrhL
MPDRANNFDTLRFLAALAVLWSHAFSLSMGHLQSEPLVVLSGGQTTIGTVAVAIFFVISGYLVVQSFERSRTVWWFAKARFLRIVPGLWVALVLLGFVVGPIVTVLPLSEYFESKELYRYVLLNGSLLGYSGRLPGVFVDNPLRWVNGSIWTLRIEAECYVLLFILGIFGVLNRYVSLGLFLAGLAYLIYDGPYTMDAFQEWNHRIDLATKFLAGVVIYHWRLPLSATAAAVCATVSMLALIFDGFWLALPTAFAYVVVFAALGATRVPNMARYGDLSYGIYIYAWPAKQLVLHYSLASTWYGVGSLATLIAIMSAFASWHLAEKRALSLKGRMMPVEDRLSERLDSAVAGFRSVVLRLQRSERA